MTLGSVSTRGTTGRRADIRERTLREDRWWLQPLVTAAVLFAFVCYATWAAFINADYFADPYISPFYSPCLATSCDGHQWWSPLGDWFRLSPALIILIFPLGFRMTCYYYRKAYYRSFWLSPPACAVAEPHKKYTGESRFPLIVQNMHRYFLYAAVLFNVMLTVDAAIAFRKDGEFHIGLGTLVLVANATLLWLYTLSCHSCRHITGGRLNNFSKHPLRYKAWTFVSKLNARHMQFAWLSLFGVALTDLYVRLVASGVFDDPRFL